MSSIEYRCSDPSRQARVSDLHLPYLTGERREHRVSRREYARGIAAQPDTEPVTPLCKYATQTLLILTLSGRSSWPTYTLPPHPLTGGSSGGRHRRDKPITEWLANILWNKNRNPLSVLMLLEHQVPVGSGAAGHITSYDYITSQQASSRL